MKRDGRGMLLVFAVGILAVLGGLAWVTIHALRLEERERRAEAQAKVQESIRLVLWRMDSAISSLIAKEAARPYFEFQPFYGAERAYTRMYDKEFSPGELLVPSPLLRGSGQFIRLHYERRSGGLVESPQVPVGNMRDLAESQLVSSDAVIAAESRLAQLRSLLNMELADASAGDSNIGKDAEEDETRHPSRARLQAGTQVTVSTGEGRFLVNPPEMAQQQRRSWAQSFKEYEARQNIATAAANAPMQSPVLQVEAGRPAETIAVEGTPTGELRFLQTTDDGRDMKKVADVSSTQLAGPSATSEQIDKIRFPDNAGFGRTPDERSSAVRQGTPDQRKQRLTTSTEPAPSEVEKESVKSDVLDAPLMRPTTPGASNVSSRVGTPNREIRGGTPIQNAGTPQEEIPGKIVAPTVGELPPPPSSAVHRVVVDDVRGREDQALHGLSHTIWQNVKQSALDSSSVYAGTPDARTVVLGAFAPRWIPQTGDRTPELVFERTVQSGDSMFVQGLWVDWPSLMEVLVQSASDLLPGATVSPVLDTKTNDPASLGSRLASIPAEITPGAIADAIPRAWSPMRTTLLFTWAGVLAAVGAIAVVLRISMELAERRGQFVSAVTHELRTPLTTFCLYSQMLDDGMVSEPASQREYIGTLRSESTRLAKIVENVLEYARLGKRRAAHDRTDIKATDLVARLEPIFRRRAEQCGLEFRVNSTGPSDAVVNTDVATVERILFNLVDNACKYASSSPIRRIDMQVTISRGVLSIAIKDHGPGVPAHERSRIFRPFFRGERQMDGSVAGLGLGLSLSRGLARELGGDLRLAESTAGAEFVLTVPVSA